MLQRSDKDFSDKGHDDDTDKYLDGDLLAPKVLHLSSQELDHHPDDEQGAQGGDHTGLQIVTAKDVSYVAGEQPDYLKGNYSEGEG
jgi:hypothetical protein